VSPPNRDLTPHAYARQCQSDAEGPDAIGVSTPERPSPQGRTDRRSRNFPALCLQVAGPLGSGGPASLADPRSDRGTQPLTLDPQRLHRGQSAAPSGAVTASKDDALLLFKQPSTT